jgi:hypothetical protein
LKRSCQELGKILAKILDLGRVIIYCFIAFNELTSKQKCDSNDILL